MTRLRASLGFWVLELENPHPPVGSVQRRKIVDSEYILQGWGHCSKQSWRCQCPPAGSGTTFPHLL